jgi:hypothetical protein
MKCFSMECMYNTGPGRPSLLINLDCRPIGAATAAFLPENALPHVKCGKQNFPHSSNNLKCHVSYSLFVSSVNSSLDLCCSLHAMPFPLVTAQNPPCYRSIVQNAVNFCNFGMQGVATLHNGDVLVFSAFAIVTIFKANKVKGEAGWRVGVVGGSPTPFRSPSFLPLVSLKMVLCLLSASTQTHHHKDTTLLRANCCRGHVTRMLWKRVYRAIP